MTAALMLAVYAIVNGNDVGWATARTIGLLAAAAVLLAIFVAIESRVSSPLVPLRLFKLRNVATANVVGVLLGRRDVRLVLPVGPLPAARARATARSRSVSPSCPSNLIMGVFSLGLSAKLVMRFGI